MTAIATIDLKTIHEIYDQTKVDYPEYSSIQSGWRTFRVVSTLHRLKVCIFLATCLYLDPDVNLETALKLRLYGGLISIDNSSLDIFLKFYNFLRLHAIPQGASGFIAEQNKNAPDYS